MQLMQIAALVSSLGLATLPAETWAQTAPDQTVNDLKQEVERLRMEAAKKQADLDSALQRIKQLEQDLAAAKSASAATPAGPARSMPPAPVPPPVPADPTIGPAGLLASLQAEYLAAFPTIPDGSDSQKMRLHFRDLETWCAKKNREEIKKYSWTGRIDPNSVVTSGRMANFTMVFDIGVKMFNVSMTAPQSMLMQVRGQGNIDNTDFVFTGVVKPKLRVDTNRPTPKTFDNPPLLAPYLVYLFDFEVSNIVPAAAEKK